MKAYIRSASCISPQRTFDSPGFLDEFVEYDENRLTCVEPDYNEIIAPKLNRRMSRIIKMSASCALNCLKAAGVASPGAIVTGTAFGSLEDTGTFLTSVIEENEEPVTPTAFVQSTHNTAGAQIALLIKCNYHNNTFVSGGISFENALQDALMLLAENEAATVLAGGMDEITDNSHTIFSRAGLYKRNPVSNASLYSQQSKGTIGGEGAAFFLLANNVEEDSLARIDGISTFYKPAGIAEIEGHINTFLIQQSINIKDIDLLITGKNGDAKQDKVYTHLEEQLFEGIPVANYKNLCGEYPTSTSFATWMAARMIKENKIPATVDFSGNIQGALKKVLIYNHYQNIYHSLILLSAC